VDMEPLRPRVLLRRCLAVVLVFQGRLEACPDDAGLALAEAADDRAQMTGPISLRTHPGLKIG